MLYNKEEHSRYVRMAGKISIAAAVVGFAVFLVAFLVDVGSQELSKVSAQTATTSLTVLNTPPAFSLNAFEVPDSATTSPVNSGDVMQWQGIAVDSNDAPYFLLVCSTNASPTAVAAADVGSLGSEPPSCDGGAVQWGVSAATPSGSIATVSTTTASTAISQFAERNEWFAWVCDDDPFNPRCNNITVQGPTSTAASSSPFHVNNRPSFSALANDGPVDPSGTLVFSSTSDDPDTIGGADTLFLVVCTNPGDYNTATNDCDSNFLASTTITLTSDVSATRTIPAIIQDTSYLASGFIVDEHGHEADANPISANFVVNNVPPEVLGGDIDLNGGLDLELTVPGGETQNLTLDFTIRDANSCQNVSAGSEIVDYTVALFRDNFHSTSSGCTGVAGDYDPNNCYPGGVGGVPTTTWNLSCTASSTQCTGPSVDQLDYECTFPLWFIADPTDSNPGFTPTDFADDQWTVAVAGIDDNASSSQLSTTSSPVELLSFTALDLATAEIPYGALEPGEFTATLDATTSVFSVGNTGLDQEVEGESMCVGFEVGAECNVSASSTIPEFEQQFASTTLAYDVAATVSEENTAGLYLLSSSTGQEVELDVLKTTATSSPNEGITYWGIQVPVTITLAGSYEGLNTFTGRNAEDADWE